MSSDAKPSTSFARALDPGLLAQAHGPVAGTKITEAYARMVAQNAYFWAWPMVNMHNRRMMFEKVPEQSLGNGILPLAPPNQLAMLSDYVDWRERDVACPNQDVVYGFGLLTLDREPVVLQVPDFGDRFWVYQVGDQRTDGFAGIGAMYGTKPGFYLVAGPDWNGTVPAGITGFFRSPTNLAYVCPRVFQSDEPADKQAAQPLIRQIMAYPLSRFDGAMKSKDWTKLPHFPSPAKSSGEAETQWVVPETFFDVLGPTLDEVPPLPGEQSLYTLFRSVLDAAYWNPKIKQAMKEAAVDANKDLIEPLFQFRNYGIPLPHNWTTVSNGAAFGTDYFTRTAVAKSNIFVNKPNETRYFYQDLDEAGLRLDGSKRYTVTFARDGLPPVKGFWSLTLYNKHHFFPPNELTRFSLGTKNKNLKYDPDGSLTVHVQADPPAENQRSNWLPAPKDEFSLFIRAYWPEAAITGGKWTPPAVKVT